METFCTSASGVALNGAIGHGHWVIATANACMRFACVCVCMCAPNKGWFRTHNARRVCQFTSHVRVPVVYLINYRFLMNACHHNYLAMPMWSGISQEMSKLCVCVCTRFFVVIVMLRVWEKLHNLQRNSVTGKRQQHACAYHTPIEGREWCDRPQL